MRFSIPIISGLLGILMPTESFKLIPMRALRDLVMEFTLNPYAFFSGGYNADATSTVQPRNTWKIN